MISKTQSFIMKPAFLSILTGFLFGTSYIPFPPWAIFFCFIPLWIVWLRENSLRRIFWTGWLAQFVFTLVGFHWIAYTIHEFGHLPWILGFGTLILFCSVANLYVPIVGLLWFFLSRRLRLNQTSQIALVVILSCAGRRLFPMIFDWNMGYTWLWARLPAFHLADIVGFNGLSDLTLIINGILLLAWCKFRAKEVWWPAAVTGPVFLLVLNFWGAIHGAQLRPTDKSLRVLIVQANIGNQEKLAAEQGSAYREVVINQFIHTTEQGLKEQGPADFAVWPETAFPEEILTPTLNAHYPMMLKEFIIRSHTKLITGGYSRQDFTGKSTNSFFVIGENGEWLAKPYHKTTLLAFGEYLPLESTFPILRRYAPEEIADFGRGPGPTVLYANGLRIGAQICYEGLFDWFTRDLANQGAQIIFNVTNDSWYGRFAEPFQHGWMTFAHAVEVRLPLVRSTNTGVSSVILASGEILELSPLHQEWFHLYEVPYASNPTPTIFMSWGYWLMPGFLVLGMLVIFLRSRTKE